MSALTDLFTNIANAIRDKSGETAEIPAAQFPTKIANLPSGAITGILSVSSSNSLTIPQAIGKQHICVLNSTENNAVTFRVLAQKAEANSANGVFIHVSSSKPIITTRNLPNGLWNPSTGVLTAAGTADEVFDKLYTWIAW